jgi:hypothetical protein
MPAFDEACLIGNGQEPGAWRGGFTTPERLLVRWCGGPR